jgi:hypothetical protein
MGIVVSKDNFVRAETNRMFADLLFGSPGLNQWAHNRELTPIDKQSVIRLNRDTLYSFAVVDISGGATVTLPESGDRYVSVMVVSQDHLINRIFHDAGTYDLTVDEHGTDYLVLAARVLVDETDPADVAACHAVQDGLVITAASAEPFVLPDYDQASFTATRDVILDEVRAAPIDSKGAFGSKDEIEPHAHLLGTAAGWGGLPEHEAYYVLREPGLPVGEYELVVRDVPVDAFWSLTVYNREGFLGPSPNGVYSVNSVTAARDADGSVTVRLGGDGSRPNTIGLMDGWNYTVRLYRPRPEILDGSWTFPELEA